MTKPSPGNGSSPGPAAGGGYHGSRRGKRSVRNVPKAPDPAEAARQAVVGYLREASVATAERGAARAAEAEKESEAVRAAGVATLERIEAAAAKVEADIAAAIQRHAEIEAGAGQAAEAAVRAAQEAWRAARSSAESDKRARISLRLIARYVTITMALLFVAIVILIVTATAVH
jgi:hypothetical protein